MTHPYNSTRSSPNQRKEWSQHNCNAIHRIVMDTRCEFNATQSIATKSSQSKCTGMQCDTHQSNTEQCEQGNVKHKTIHMQIRRRAPSSNMQELSETQEPREPREPGTGSPSKDSGETGLKVASTIGSFRERRRKERGTPWEDGRWRSKDTGVKEDEIRPCPRGIERGGTEEGRGTRRDRTAPLLLFRSI